MKQILLSINKTAIRLVSVAVVLFLVTGTGCPVLSADAAPSVHDSFSDVSDPSAYYYKPVYWAAAHGITNGVSDTDFGITYACSRAQIVTFLWRAAGQPEPENADNPFRDVLEDAYYNKAVLWAVEKELTQGTDADRFSPDEYCSRAQCVTFLWRFYQSPDDGTRSDFKDVPDDSYYAPAVFWALKNGVSGGISTTAFSPDRTCTREEVTTFLYRSMMVRMEKKELPDPESVKASVGEPEVDGTAGEIRIIVSELSCNMTLDSVRASVWTRTDQSDLRWFTLGQTLSGEEGSYQTTFNVSDFDRFFGTYSMSLYVIVSSGTQVQQIHLEDRSFTIAPCNYMYAEDPLSLDGKIHVVIQGVSSDYQDVQFAAWSAANSWDDLFFTDAETGENGVWSASIDCARLRDSGVCTVEAYVDHRSEIINSISVSVPPDSVMTECQRRIFDYTQQVYSQAGRDLYACFQYSVGLPYDKTTPLPQSGYNNSEWYALYGFKNHKGNCYARAATFYWLARNMGYEVYYLQGAVRTTSGYAIHGWCEIVLDGELYVMDPSFEAGKKGRNGFQFRYGTKGTWIYIDYQRMA